MNELNKYEDNAEYRQLLTDFCEWLNRKDVHLAEVNIIRPQFEGDIETKVLFPSSRSSYMLILQFLGIDAQKAEKEELNELPYMDFHED